ncbi:hypothetical protein [Symbioplanes lichenis]|uniref:hypothetical protein n=1 Tax=Symbioplanes lichenis TaxID=1629072 RepID=UPI0027384EB4|nr:hypothetical protein [Actinoplanes lichenis]
MHAHRPDRDVTIPPAARRGPAARAPGPVTPGGRLDAGAAQTLQRTVGNAAVQAMLTSGPPVVQRVSYDEMHTDPPGTATRVRGPRKSRARDKAPAKIRDQGRWDTAANAYQQWTGAAPDRQRAALQTDYRTQQELSPPGSVTTFGNAVFSDLLANNPNLNAVSNDVLFEQLGRADQTTQPYWQQQDRRDAGIIEDAVTREGDYQAAGGPAQAAAVRATADTLLNPPGATAPPQPADAAALNLLQNFNGLAVGGVHNNEPFFAWAVTHMAALRAGGVTTIYIEALRDDAHQALVDHFFQTPTTAMSPELTNFVANYQMGNHVDLGAFLTAARAQGVRVRAMSGRPARRVGSDLHRRAAAMNTYSEQVIRHDQATNPGNYLVQVGESHLGEHTNPAAHPTTVAGHTLPDRFPGLDQLLGIPGVRLAEMVQGGLQLELV